MDFWGPCPACTMSSHKSGDFFNIPKNKAAEGQNTNDHNIERHNGHRYYYLARGQGWGCGCGLYNVPCLTSPFPTFFIQQAPTNVPMDDISTVTNTDTSSVIPKQTYMDKPMNYNRCEKNG